MLKLGNETTKETFMYKKMVISDDLSFYKNKSLNVQLDDEDVNLGLIVETLNIVDATGEGDENYPFVVSMGLIASKPHVSFDESEGNLTGIGLIWDCNSYMGSVPVDHILVNDTNGKLDQILKLFNVGEAKLVTEEVTHGTVAAQNGKTKFSYLMFANEEVAQKYIDFIIQDRAPVLNMMVGFILDRPINMMGESGWSMVEKMHKGC